MSKIAVFLGLLACAGLIEVALAHGGHLHDGSPLTRGYPTVVIKSSNKFITLRKAKEKYGFSTKPSMAGSAQVISYLYGNCTNKLSSAVLLDVTVTTLQKKFGKDKTFGKVTVPVVNATFTGGVFTGSCTHLQKSTRNTLVEINNSTTAASRYIWFDQATTNVTGRIAGYGANDGMPKNANFRSVVFFELDPNVSLAENMAYYLNNRAMFCAPLGSATAGWQTALDGKGIVC